MVGSASSTTAFLFSILDFHFTFWIFFLFQLYFFPKLHKDIFLKYLPILELIYTQIAHS